MARDGRRSEHRKRSNSPQIPGWFRLGYRTLSALSPRLAAALGERLFLRTRRFEPPHRERELLQQAAASEVESAGGALPVWTWEPAGGEDAGTVLLVHGWEGRGSQMGAFVEPLVGAGFRVVAHDAPGHGAAPGEISSMVLLTEALEAVAERVGPLAGQVAHSAGTVATGFALSRGGLELGRAVFVAPGVGALDYSQQFADLLGISEETRRRLQERIERRIGAAWAEFEPLDLAPSMGVPLLVISDRDDRETPLPSAQALAAAWPGARLEVTEGLGHRRILWNPSVTRKAAGFLAGG